MPTTRARAHKHLVLSVPGHRVDRVLVTPQVLLHQDVAVDPAAMTFDQRGSCQGLSCVCGGGGGGGGGGGDGGGVS